MSLNDLPIAGFDVVLVVVLFRGIMRGLYAVVSNSARSGLRR
jgi:hypothetical protein